MKKISFLLWLLLFWNLAQGNEKIIRNVKVSAPSTVDLTEIRSELASLKGTPFSNTKINDLVKRLYHTQKFHNIYVHTLPLSPSEIEVRFVLELSKQVEFVIFEGNTLFSEIELLRTIQTTRDQAFNKNNLVEDKIRLEALYQDQGYFNTDIQIQFFSPESSHLMNITFKITENSPSHIRKLTIDSEGALKTKHLRPRINIQEGDIYKPPLLKEELVGLKKYFVEKRYLEARVVSEDVSFSPDKKDVDIYLKILPGPQFYFETAGHLELSEHDLLTPLREYEEEVPQASLEDLVKYIVKRYKKLGFFHVQVTYQSFTDPQRGKKLIRFNIQENARVSISKFNFIGNKHFSAPYYNEFIQRSASDLIREGLYHPDDLEESSQLISDHLKTQGFLFATTKVGSLHWNSSRTEISPDIEIEEGSQTILNQIQISGNKNLKEAEILEALEFGQGSSLVGFPLDLFQIDLRLKKIIDLYRENGFLKAKIQGVGSEKLFTYSQDYTAATLHIQVEEGFQARIGKIIYRGTVRTRNRVMEREIPIQPGAIWNPKDIQRAESRLLRLGLFSSVRIVPLSGEFKPGENDTVIEVIERLPGLMEFGGGFATDDGVRGYTGIAYRNIGGWNRVLSARAAINRPLVDYDFLERKIQLGLTEPYLGGIPFFARFNASHLKQSTLPFDERSWQAKFSLDKWAGDFLHVDLQYLADFRHIFRAINRDDIQKNLAASIGPSLLFDFRDDAFNPSRGSFHTVSSHFYLPEIGSSEKVDLVRLMGTTGWYFTPWSRLTLAFLVRGGYARSFSNSFPVPVDLRYYLGGRSTIRGFKEDEIGADTKNKRIFENSFINYRSETKFHLWNDFGLALFFDGGNVFFDDIDDPQRRINKFRHSFGPGIRYQTPIGPLSFDFGFIISRDQAAHEPIGRFHFSIGTF